MFLPIFKMNFPEIMDIARGAHAPSRVVFGALAKHFLRVRSPHSSSRRWRRLEQPRVASLPYKIMHGLWGLGQMMFTKYLVVVDGGVDVHNTGKSSSASAPSPARNALAAPEPWKAEQPLD